MTIDLEELYFCMLRGSPTMVPTTDGFAVCLDRDDDGIGAIPNTPYIMVLKSDVHGIELAYENNNGLNRFFLSEQTEVVLTQLKLIFS